MSFDQRGQNCFTVLSFCEVEFWEAERCVFNQPQLTRDCQFVALSFLKLQFFKSRQYIQKVKDLQFCLRMKGSLKMSPQFWARTISSGKLLAKTQINADAISNGKLWGKD